MRQSISLTLMRILLGYKLEDTVFSPCIIQMPPKRRLSIYLPIRMRFTSILQEVVPTHIIFGVLIQMVLCVRASSCLITGMHYPKDK